MKAGSSLRWVAIIGGFFAAAVAISGTLYVRTRGADLGRHARAIEMLGVVRHADELLSKQVLAARFGLLNQYDPLNATQLELTLSCHELAARIEAAVGKEAELGESLTRLEEAVAQQRETIERFKAENSILRNSLCYMPTAEAELANGDWDIDTATPATAAAQLAIGALSRAALVYGLAGDESARAKYRRALAELGMRRASLPQEDAARAELLLSHGRVIRDAQPEVDGLLKRALAGEIGERLDQVERQYHKRFNAVEATSSGYRRMLYGWSLFLAIAVGTASMQLRRLYSDLERRVAHRTTELAKALDALWGEMKLARKIQEALVPASPTLLHCDVAVAMRSAEEVGGDYYDVVAAGGREWILIGDVSGHGVSAGLVMMMCHTAVRAILTANPETTPERLLAQVNTVLTENIRRLGEDKYMSITAFKREPDGTIWFAGAHQDVFVYRAETDAVELWETEGLWLGLKEQIAESLRAKRLQLGAGDVLVLHTDGITEAARDGAMFDTAGLRRVLGGSRGKTSSQILDDTFRALDGFTVNDDATLLVVRQLP